MGQNRILFFADLCENSRCGDSLVTRNCRKRRHSTALKSTVSRRSYERLTTTIETPKYSEPKKIAIKNGSGIQLYEVFLREKTDSTAESFRVGQISPVPIGATQLIARPSSPPPFPRKVIISWIDSTQRQYNHETSLEIVLSTPSIETIDILVFEIGPSGRIRVYAE